MSSSGGGGGGGGGGNVAEDIRQSLVRWLNTFPGVRLSASDFGTLADGAVLVRVMHDM